jgi:hypothetical protein
MPNDTPTTEQGSAADQGAALLALQNQEVTSLADWVRPNQNPKIVGFVIELPSGNRVRMTRGVDLLTMIKEGRIPNPLADVINEMINKRGETDAPKVAELPIETLQQLLQFVDKLTEEVILEPKLASKPYPSEEGADTWVCPEGYGCVQELLTVDDRFFIFGVALGGAANLKQFREQQEAALANLSNGDPVQSAPSGSPLSLRPLPGVVSR